MRAFARSPCGYAGSVRRLRHRCQLKAIFFDAAGTFIHLPRSVGEHYREVAAGFGCEPGCRCQLDRAFRSAWASSPARSSDHQPAPRRRQRLVARLVVYRVLADVLPYARGAHASFDSDGYFEAVYAHFAAPGVWATYPEVHEVLAELRKRRV